jgi:glycine cleavage system aminomethyltransferase T
MLARGTQRLGEKIRIHHLGQVIDAEVVKAPFIDPKGDRLHG